MIKYKEHSEILAFAGRKRSGKGMLSNGIKNMYGDGAVVISVADNLKFLCAKLLNVSLSKLDKMKDDGTVFCEKVNGYWVSTINEFTGIPTDVICEEIGGKTFTSVRNVLQVIGTDLIRKHIPEWHIDKTIERIKELREDGMVVIIDDIRFSNEKCKIEELGGEVFFVIRPDIKNGISNHPSEVALKYTDFAQDCVIINDQPIDVMVKSFYDYYFRFDNDSSVLLYNNPWYITHSIDMSEGNDNNFNVDRLSIIKLVAERMSESPQFINNGIITFHSEDNHIVHLFRRIIMNDRRGSDGNHDYVVYNPLTNEVLKEFM